MDIIARLFHRLSPDTTLKFSFIITWLLLDVGLFIRFGTSQPLSTSLILYAGMVAVLFVIAALYEKTPGPGLLFYAMSMSILLIIPVVLFCFIAPATPAIAIDPILKRLDTLMGFHADTVALWVQTHTGLQAVLRFAYRSIFYELYCFIMILAMLGDRETLQKFMLTLLFCYTFALIFYLFFPSLAPAYSYPDMTASLSQSQVIDQFFLLHHHDALYFHNLAIIAFPSFHAIWAMSIVVFAYQRKLLFYVLLVLNILVVISAVTLGWHYLAQSLPLLFITISY